MLEHRSTLYRLLAGRTRFYGGIAPVAHLKEGRLCGQSRRGACRSEGLVFGEHVPDRLGQPSGDIDLGDLRAALLAEAALVALVALTVDVWRQAWVAASISAQRRYFGPAWVSWPRRSFAPDW